MPRFKDSHVVGVRWLLLIFEGRYHSIQRLSEAGEVGGACCRVGCLLPVAIVFVKICYYSFRMI